MSGIELLVLGMALAMDAFAVTISDTFAYRGQARWRMWMAPVAFAVFQALMPVAGYWLGNLFAEAVETYEGIVSFIILGFIGGSMIREGVKALRGGEADEAGASTAAAPDAVHVLTVGTVVMQAIATSIDAFAVGVSLRAANADIFASALAIGATTFACCTVALLAGRRFGEVLGDRAQVLGGVVLVAIGLKALLGL